MNNKNFLIKDIEPLQEVSFFPLAIVWWLVIFLFIALIIGLISYFIIRKKSKDIINIVNYLKLTKDDIEKQDSHQIIIKISKIIRLLAIRKFSRKDCASLIDKEWLLWLTKNDPNKFNWLKEADILTRAPYMKKFNNIANIKITKIIDATLGWI
jgi:hypothetical protein